MKCPFAELAQILQDLVDQGVQLPSSTALGHYQFWVRKMGPLAFFAAIHEGGNVGSELHQLLVEARSELMVRVGAA